MSYLRPDENTLGVIVGRRGRPRERSLSMAARILRSTGSSASSLGSGHLGGGLALAAGAQGLFGLWQFLGQYPIYRDVLPVTLAWLLYTVAFVATVVAVAILGLRMPTWLFLLLLVALGGVILLDFLSIWGLGDIGAHATASVSASFGLLLAVTYRARAELLVAGALIGVAFAAAILLTTPLTADTAPAQLGMIGLVLAPPLFGSWLIAQYRRMVQLELDRVLVQSTVSAPRFAVGMLASEELARLDLNAEELFDSVAGGRTPLPLDPKTASIAATLATELRLHLIEGRRETWLHHAIVESEQLGRTVTLSDTGSLAGLLDQNQRDGLLSAVWFLAADSRLEGPAVQLTVHPASEAPGADTVQISVPITITASGTSRSRIDPSVWSALEAVGESTHTWRGSRLEVQLRCLVVNPAEQYHAEQATPS